MYSAQLRPKDTHCYGYVMAFGGFCFTKIPTVYPSFAEKLVYFCMILVKVAADTVTIS